MTGSAQEPHNQAQLLEAIAASWSSCVTLINGLTDAQWTGSTDARGWTLKDHVAQVTAWENVVIEVFRVGAPQYVTLQIPEDEWAAGGTDGADAVIHASKSGQSLHRVKNNRDVTHARLVSLLTALPEEALHRPFSDFGAVDAHCSVLVEMMDLLVKRYDRLCAAIAEIVNA